MLKRQVHTQILVAVTLGVFVGGSLLWLGNLNEHFLPVKDFLINNVLQTIGDLFIQLLKMIIVPLIMATMVSGVVSIGHVGRLGRIGSQTFIYYLMTTLLAISIGLVMVNLITPGIGAELPQDETFSAVAHQAPSFSEILKDMVPSNLIGAMARGDVLPVIFFSLLFGSALLAVREKAQPVIAFFKGFDAAMMTLVGWVMRLAPIGVFALMAVMVGKLGPGVFKSLAKYVITVLLGLGIHAFVVLPVLLHLFGGRNPLVFIKQMSSALITAYSTASSAATLPISMECLEENAGVPKRITSFVMPIGATVNMDGTALYEAVTAMFIAQAYGIEITPTSQLLIVVASTLASVGAAAIPNAGLITMVIVLRAVGLPLEGIGIIWGVERLLDMFRTAVNVWGDSCGAAIVAKLNE